MFFASVNALHNVKTFEADAVALKYRTLNVIKNRTGPFHEIKEFIN